MNEIFDNGDNDGKIIKGSKNVYEAKGVPQNMLVHSDIYGLIDSNGIDEKFKTFLSRGLVRRSNLCIPKLEKKLYDLESIDVEKEYERIETAMSNVQILKEYFTNANLATLPSKDEFYNNETDEYERVYKKIRITKEDYFHYLKYKRSCVNRTIELSNRLHHIALVEIEGRHWKMIKLAGIIACFEHPDDLRIKKSDIDLAIYQTDYFGETVSELMEEDTFDDIEKLYDFIKESNGVATMDIRNKKFAPKDKFKFWFNDASKLLSEFCEAREEKLIIKKNGSTGKKYYIGKETESDKKDAIINDFVNNS